MRLLLFPVTSILDHSHVLLNFDFVAKMKDITTKEYAMNTYCEPLQDTGSVKTVCDIIRKNKTLRVLLNIPEDDDELLAASTLLKVSISNPTSLTASTGKANLLNPQPGPTSLLPQQASSQNVGVVNTKVSHNLLDSATTNKNKQSQSSILTNAIESFVDVKTRLRFFSLGEDADVCICAVLVDHMSSYYLNASSNDKQRITSNNVVHNANDHQSHVSHQTSTITRRDHYYFWICIRDLRDQLIALNKSIKQKGLPHVLSLIDQWVSLTVNNNSISPKMRGLNDDVKTVKQRFRCMIWDLMEQKQEIMFPHPCHGRIPNFRGREAAAENLAALTTFKQARVVKINPSLAQEHIRFLTLASSKVLLTPSPALESAVPFYKIDPRFLSRKQIQRAATKSGAASLGSMVSLSGLGNIEVDLVVVGSVVVNPITGARLGKGFGYSDLEYAIMSYLGVVKDNNTVIATVVHESQLVNDLPDEVMCAHDLPVNLVATPKRVVFTRCSFPKPKEILWSEVNEQMFTTIPVLKDLYDRIEHKRRESACYNNNVINEYNTVGGDPPYIGINKSDCCRQQAVISSELP
ncbi:hypothetical protein GJ496_010141 [Pomphorhynchus laevis]|nr:hypothetical protein GJ496_010141 [Pomphorhynchus laevis]